MQEEERFISSSHCNSSEIRDIVQSDKDPRSGSTASDWLTDGDCEWTADNKNCCQRARWIIISLGFMVMDLFYSLLQFKAERTSETSLTTL